MRSFESNPVKPIAPTAASSNPKTTVSHCGCARVCSRAPANPPRALVTPKVRRTLLSMNFRNTKQRSPVATRCGIVIAATANFVPNSNASKGVNKLPMPKPVIDAIAPAIVAAKGSQIVESTSLTRVRFWSQQSSRTRLHRHRLSDALDSMRRARIICVRNVAHLLSPSHSEASVTGLSEGAEKDCAPVRLPKLC